jgi:hypothetical protein
MSKEKKKWFSSKKMANLLQLPNSKYFFVMLCESGLISSNYDGANYGVDNRLLDKKYIKYVKNMELKWSEDSIEFLQVELKLDIN